MNSKLKNRKRRKKEIKKNLLLKLKDYKKNLKRRKGSDKKSKENSS